MPAVPPWLVTFVTRFYRPNAECTVGHPGNAGQGGSDYPPRLTLGVAECPGIFLFQVTFFKGFT